MPLSSCLNGLFLEVVPTILHYIPHENLGMSVHHLEEKCRDWITNLWELKWTLINFFQKILNLIFVKNLFCKEHLTTCKVPHSGQNWHKVQRQKGMNGVLLSSPTLPKSLLRCNIFVAANDLSVAGVMTLLQLVCRMCTEHEVYCTCCSRICFPDARQHFPFAPSYLRSLGAESWTQKLVFSWRMQNW